MKTHIALFAFLTFGSCPCLAVTTNGLFTAEQVAAMIGSGSLGQEFAERAQKTGDLHLREVSQARIPFQIFTFSDYKAGYSVLVESGCLILLCSGFGGGDAYDFQMADRDGKRVLTYKFHVGSGISRELSGEYVLGSGKAEWPTSEKRSSQPGP